MRNNPIATSEKLDRLTLSHVAFFAFFPGYSLYQSLIVYGYLPPLFGGFSTFVSLCFAPFLLFMVFRNFSSGVFRLNYSDLTFLLFWILFLTTALIGYLTLFDQATPIAHFSVLIQFFTFYCCLRLMPQSSSKTTTVFGVSFFVVCAVMLTSSGAEDVERIAASARLDEVYFRDYQGYALSGIVSGILFAARLNRPLLRFLVYLSLIFSLYMNGARSELIASLPAVLLIEYLIERRVTLALGGVVFASLAGGLVLLASIGSDPSNRTLALLQDYQSDVSYNERLYASDIAKNTIDTSPIMGDYASYPEGLYAHNMLSAWVDLGFFGFGVYFAIIIAPAFFLLRNHRLLESHDIAALAAFTLVMVLLVLFAKGFTYKLLPVLIGLHASVVAVAQSRKAGV